MRHTVIVGRAAARDEVLAVVVKREHHLGLQAFEQHLQVLLHREQRLYLRMAAAVVALLRAHGPGVVALYRGDGDGAVGITCGMDVGRGLKGFGEDLVGATVRLAQVLQIAADVEAQQGRRREVQVDVGAHVVAGELAARVVVERRVGLHDAVLVINRGCQRVAEYLGAARDGHVGARRVGIVLGDGVDPVHVRIEVTVVARIGLQHLVLGEHARIELVEEVHVFGGAHKLRQFGRRLDRLLHTEVDRRLGHLAALGVDDDDTIGAAHTVHGAGRGILQ